MKPNLISQFAKSALIALGCSSVANASHPQGNYGYFPGLPIAIGKGFTPKAPMNDHQMCFRGLKTTPVNSGGNDGTEVRLNLVKGTQSIKKVLGIDSKIDASYLVFKGGGEFNLDLDTDISREDIHVVIQGKSDYSGSTLDFSDASYLPDIQRLLDQGNHREVIRRCGPELINTVRRGSSVAVIITIKGLSRDEQNKYDLKVSASGGIGPLSANGSYALNNLMSSSTSNRRLSFQAFVKGGTGVNALSTLVGSLIASPKDLSELKEGVIRVMENLTPETGAITGFSTIPFPGVELDHQSLISDLKADKLTEITTVYRVHHSKYERLNQLYLSKDHLGQNPKEFFGILEELIDWARAELPELERYVKTLGATHWRCLQDPDDLLPTCILPKPPILRHLDMVDQLSRF